MNLCASASPVPRSPLAIAPRRASGSQTFRKRRVLLVGQHEDLLLTRAAIIRGLGAEVTCVKSPELMRSARLYQSAVVVLCHSIDLARRVAIASRVHEDCPSARVLQLLPMHDPYAEGTDGADLTCVAEPYKLARCISELLLRP